MSQYLKRIEISNVGNVEEEIQSQYLKRVHVVEVVDSDGNPWEPEPGPDPWDELAVSTTVVTGEPFVGEIATVVPPTIAGGVEPYDTSYTFTAKYPSGARSENVSTASSDNTKVIARDEAGWIIQAYVRVSDQVGHDVLKMTTSGVGPVNWRSFGNVRILVNNVELDLEGDAASTVTAGDPVSIQIEHDGDASPTYTINPRNNYPLIGGGSVGAHTQVYFTETGVAVLSIELSDPNTEEETIGYPISFLVTA